MLDVALAHVALRRRLGIFYTPDEVALALARWAVQGNVGPVLDPSFGGCSFLRAALTALAEAGAEDFYSLIHGVDVDPQAADYVQDLLDQGVNPKNIVIKNFFSTVPGDLGKEPFRAIIGNPPYVRHHWMTSDEKEAAGRRIDEADVALSGQGSAWAYFVAHSLNFLAFDGRLAFVLPGSILHTEYGREVIALMEGNFAQVHLVHIREQLFPNVDEISVIAFCQGRGHGPATAKYSHIPMDELNHFCSGSVTSSPTIASSWKLHHLAKQERDAYASVLQNECVKTLGDCATISIGIVTGANEFFVRTPKLMTQLGPSLSSTSPALVTKPSMLQGTRWTNSDQAASEKVGALRFLLNIPQGHRVGKRLRTLIDEAEKRNWHERYKCSCRDPWYSLSDFQPPDAFLPYMVSMMPTIVINEASSVCLNNIHRIWFDKDVARHAISVASWTSLFQLSAEVNGRAYGGGVLKLEPSEARRLVIPLIPHLGLRAREINRVARQKGKGEAMKMADELVLDGAMKLSRTTINALRRGAKRLHDLRQPRRPAK